MRNVLLAMAMAMAAAAPAAAKDTVTLSHQAASCWSVPAGAAGFTAEFDVTLIDKGEVGRVDLISYAPDSALAPEIATSASVAIERCQPYDQVGTFRFVMDSRLASKAP